MPQQRAMAKPVAPAQHVTSDQATASTPGMDANYVADNDDDALPVLDANYVSDNEEDDMNNTTIHHRARLSKRVMQQIRQNERDDLNRVAFLAANKQAAIPDLIIKSKKLARG